MGILNTKEQWGLVSIVFHWLSAITIIGLFALGWWMVELNYYSDWYKVAPNWHRSMGVLLIGVIILRILWRWFNTTPDPIGEHRQWEKIAAKWTHLILYAQLLFMLPTGYLITTAKGQSLDVFDWFSIPATIQSIDNLEDIAGVVHKYIAYSMIGLASVHMLGAVKHHVVDRDATLKRMLGIKR